VSDSYLDQDAQRHLSGPSPEADVDPYLIHANAMPNAIRVHAGPPLPSTTITERSTIRLLEPGTSTLSAKLLRLATTGIGNEKAAVELDQSGLEGALRVLVDVFGKVGNL